MYLQSMVKRVSQITLAKLNQLDIIEVGKRLGAKIDSRGFSLCIMHEEKNPSLHFNCKTNSFYCFGCHRGGNVISLVKYVNNLDFLESVNWLMHEFSIYDEDIPTTIQTSRKVVKQIITKPENNYQPDRELLDWIIEVAGLSDQAKRFLFQERLYSPESVKKCKVKSITSAKTFVRTLIGKFGVERCLKSGIILQSSKKQSYYTIFSCPCLLFPYYDAKGQIYTIQARSFDTDNKRKYIFPKGCPTYIFNLEAALHADCTTPLYIAEGPTDCLAYLSEGKLAVGIPGSGAFKKEYVEYLKDKSLFMYADNDLPGENLFIAADALLRERGGAIMRIPLDKEYKDYSDYHVARFK